MTAQVAGAFHPIRPSGHLVITLPPPSLTPLTPAHLPALLRALRREPVSNLFLLHLARRTGLRPSQGGPAFYGHLDDRGEVLGAGAFGATLLAWSPLPETLPLLCDEALRRKGRWKSLLGDARTLDPLWAGLEREAGRPLENHTEDWMALPRDGFAPSPAPLDVRVASEKDLPRILPLRFAMQEEEDRILTSEDRERVRRRCRESIRDGHLFYVEDEGEVVFTAAFSADPPEAAQISSVFTRADRRGRGIASRALSPLIDRAFQTSERVSLFVLPDNAPAQAVYRKLGFRRFATARSIRVR